MRKYNSYWYSGIFDQWVTMQGLNEKPSFLFRLDVWQRLTVYDIENISFLKFFAKPLIKDKGI
jgi:hypothetical protein